MNEGAYFFSGLGDQPASTLLRRACPTPQDVPFFNRCMAKAREMGLEWTSALGYVIEQRERELEQRNQPFAPATPHAVSGSTPSGQPPLRHF